MRFKLFSVIIATVLVLIGCQGTNNNTQEGQGTGDEFERTRTTKDRSTNYSTQNVADRPNNQLEDRDRNSNNRNSNNRQDEYDVSEEAADRIVDEVAEIDQAYVLTTRNNAYVAAVLDDDNATDNDNITRNDRRNNSAGMNVRHVNDRNVRDRTVNEGDSNERRQDNHIANRRDREADEVTDEVKNRIADIVQDVDNDIDNVYVTTSPDFLDLTENYVNDMNDGKPVRGFFDQIGNTIERIFPQNKR